MFCNKAYTCVHAYDQNWLFKCWLLFILVGIYDIFKIQTISLLRRAVLYFISLTFLNSHLLYEMCIVVYVSFLFHLEFYWEFLGFCTLIQSVFCLINNYKYLQRELGVSSWNWRRCELDFLRHAADCSYWYHVNRL